MILVDEDDGFPCLEELELWRDEVHWLDPFLNFMGEGPQPGFFINRQELVGNRPFNIVLPPTTGGVMIRNRVNNVTVNPSNGVAFEVATSSRAREFSIDNGRTWNEVGEAL